MKRALLFGVIVLCAGIINGQDPVATDPTKYKAILENDRVRVLEFRDHPGEKTTRHSHPDTVVYALGPFKRKITLDDGKTSVSEMKEGQVTFIRAQTHIGENIGKTDTHAILIELKEPPGVKSKKH
jgi:hypothetical protein